MPDSHLWYIVDMDDGIVRRDPRKAGALHWCEGQAEGRILPGPRKTLSPGFYEYFIGFDIEDCTQFWIARGDAAVRQGFDITQEPIYPYPDRPYERGPRGEASQ